MADASMTNLTFWESAGYKYSGFSKTVQVPDGLGGTIGVTYNQIDYDDRKWRQKPNGDNPFPSDRFLSGEIDQAAFSLSGKVNSITATMPLLSRMGTENNYSVTFDFSNYKASVASSRATDGATSGDTYLAVSRFFNGSSAGFTQVTITAKTLDGSVLSLADWNLFNSGALPNIGATLHNAKIFLDKKTQTLSGRNAEGQQEFCPTPPDPGSKLGGDTGLALLQLPSNQRYTSITLSFRQEKIKGGNPNDLHDIYVASNTSDTPEPQPEPVPTPTPQPSPTPQPTPSIPPEPCQPASPQPTPNVYYIVLPPSYYCWYLNKPGMTMPCGMNGGCVFGHPPMVTPGQPGTVSPGQPPTVIPGQPGTVSPGQPPTVIPGQPGTVSPGQPPTVIPGQPGTVSPSQPPTVIPGQPGTVSPGQPPTVIPGQPGTVSPSQPPTTGQGGLIISISGSWSSVVISDNSSINGIGTNQISWGIPADTGFQSSYLFNGISSISVPLDGSAFILGTLSHFNYEITGSSISTTTLSLILNISGVNVPFSFVFSHTETSNQGVNGICPATPSHGPPCPDVVSVKNVQSTETVVIDGQQYALSIVGFWQDNQLVNQMITAENQITTVQLYAQLVPVGGCRSGCQPTS